ncbi:ankyrin repeat-containing domain protein [Microdochium trichocladiopsis]|uniref:Ankyrin repeat-containing domain protein n=1 Tax=Microdochium trichocladiopsis TaxID=1682393 RepID=A0A9P8YF20_9PEZI|nr:ankyrin repeat-containing domain protein [Microdochium trichocladiopsis]KAH7035808.1 ankyrin repeat-containing domain protein [Microdochium trichocladiopsis]
MPACFASLQPELILCINEFLPVTSQAQLAATSTELRSLLHNTVCKKAIAAFPYLIHWAAQVGLTNLVSAFLNAGADPNTKCAVQSWQKYKRSPARTILLRMYKHDSRSRKQSLYRPDLEFNFLSGGDFFDEEGWSDYVSDHANMSDHSIRASYKHQRPERHCMDVEFYSDDEEFAWRPEPYTYKARFQPLHAACSRGHAAIVKLLLEHGAEAHGVSSGLCRCILPSPKAGDWCTCCQPQELCHHTPLLLAVCHGKHDVVDVVLQLCATDAATGNNLINAAFMAALNKGDGMLVTKFLNAPYNVDVNDCKVAGLTPLAFCVLRQRSLGVLRLLLDNGAEPNDDLGSGRSTIANACLSARYEAAAIMLPYSKDPDVFFPSNPEMRAIAGPYSTRGGLSLVQVTRPLEYIAAGSLTALQYIAPLHASENPLPVGKNGRELKRVRNERLAIEAHERQRVKLVEELLKKGANVHATPRSHHTPIVLAAASHSTDVMSVILKAGGQIGQEDSVGFFPLLAAASSHFGLWYENIPVRMYTVLKFLLEHGADPNQASSKTGQTSLMVLCDRISEHDIVSWKDIDLLIKAGADINASDHDGITPLMAAKRKEDQDKCDLLVKRGARESPAGNASAT